jgi:hypothetical protein
MAKYALFVFNGDPMCFVHVLLNALDLAQRGNEPRIVIEGAATRLVKDLAEADFPLYALWRKARGKGLVAGVCKACASRMGTRAAAEAQGLALLDDMSGHPSMGAYREAGYDILTF